MPSSAVQQLSDLVAEGKVELVDENNLELADRAVYDASYQNLERVMIDPTRPNKNKGEVCSLAYAKATGIPVFATDEMNLQPIIDKQLNTGMHTICNINIVLVLNLKQFYTPEQVQQIYEFCFYEKIFLINVEGIKSYLTKEEKCAIIDKDLCLIYSDND